MDRFSFWLAVVGISGAALAPPAQAQTQQQLNALNNIAEATVAASLCPKIKANEAMMAMALVYWKIDMGSQKYKDIYQKKLGEKLQALKKYDTELICVTAVVMYGPNGTNVPDFIIKQ